MFCLWFVFSYCMCKWETPEDQVELYEALVEVLDASLEGEGELHQLHQVLVLVRILLSD